MHHSSALGIFRNDVYFVRDSEAACSLAVLFAIGYRRRALWNSPILGVALAGVEVGRGVGASAALKESAPAAALAATIASRSEQSAVQAPSLVSAVLVTVKVAG